MGHMACGAPAVSTLLSLFSQLRPPPPPPPHPTPSQSQKCSQNFTIHTLLTFLTLPFDSLHILLPSLSLCLLKLHFSYLLSLQKMEPQELNF